MFFIEINLINLKVYNWYMSFWKMIQRTHHTIGMNHYVIIVTTIKSIHSNNVWPFNIYFLTIASNIYRAWKFNSLNTEQLNWCEITNILNINTTLKYEYLCKLSIIWSVGVKDLQLRVTAWHKGKRLNVV